VSSDIFTTNTERNSCIIDGTMRFKNYSIITKVPVACNPFKHNHSS